MFWTLSLGRRAAMFGFLYCGLVAPVPAAVTTSVAWTSDYVWRGTTQTSGGPALQAGVRLAGDSGFYASLWGSNVEFAPALRASSEFDFSVGWSGRISDRWSLDANVLHYRYPSTSIDLNWTEFNGTLTFRADAWVSLGWSKQALGSESAGTYLLLGGKVPLGERLRIEAVIARYALGDLDGDGENDRYAHGALSAVWALPSPFEARLTWHATDRHADAVFGDEWAGDRLEAALQATF